MAPLFSFFLVFATPLTILTKTSLMETIAEMDINANMGNTTHIEYMKDGRRVTSVQELVEEEGIESVPLKYIRPSYDRPCFPILGELEEPPIINMEPLLFGNNEDEKKETLRNIGKACEDWGFFQVVNHGVKESVVQDIWKASMKFFSSSTKERMKYYSEDLGSKVSYMTSFNTSKEKVGEWKDSIIFRYIPGQYDEFQDAPSFCKNPIIKYLDEMRCLASRIYGALSESLGLEVDCLERAMGGSGKVTIPMHYYPPCPDPSLTMGLSSHSDPNTITILLQDEVGGLQVLKDGSWVPIKSHPNAFIVNLGDQIQILSNGKYKSVEHRVVTNSSKARMSIPCFFCPPLDTKIAPLPSLIEMENKTPLYKPIAFRDYLHNFNNIGLARKSGLEFCLIHNHHHKQIQCQTCEVV